MIGRIVLGMVLGVVVYGFMTLWSDVDSIREALHGFPLTLVPAAMGLSLLNYLLRFIRWEGYRKLLGVNLGVRDSFMIHLSGLALTVTPGKMGEAFKSILIREAEGSPLAHTAPIVIAERFTDLLGFLVLVAVGGLATAPEHAWVFWGTLALCAALIALIAWPAFTKLACEFLEHLPLLNRAAQGVRAMVASTRVLMSPSQLPLPTLVATLGWGLECTGFWLIANALCPAELPFLFAVYVFAISAVAGAVVLFTPGGLGVTEGLMTALTSSRMRTLGMAPAAATAAAVSATVLIRLCTLWFAMGLGVVALALYTHGRTGKAALPDQG